MWGSSLANTALFALLFPLYVIMAIHARPLPTYPQTPVPPLMNYGTSEERSLKPNPLLPIRLPVLTGPVFLNDFLLNLCGARKGGKKTGIIGEEIGGDGGIPMEEGTSGGWIGIKRGVGSGLGMSSSLVGGLNARNGSYGRSGGVVSSSSSALSSSAAVHTRVRGKKLD